jgi:hypothetical protein
MGFGFETDIDRDTLPYIYLYLTFRGFLFLTPISVQRNVEGQWMNNSRSGLFVRARTAIPFSLSQGLLLWGYW